MYVPAQFREERTDVLAQAMTAIQLATLVTCLEGAYHASHVPMVVIRGGDRVVLESHVARPNEHWRLAVGGVPSLAVFQGPQAYVSPSWYESKRQHGKVVPTWNYIAVHAHGQLEAIEDEAWIAAHLDALTAANEAGREAPWAVSDAPADFVRNLSRAIVGLRLVVEKLEGAWKLIQHRPDGDRHGTIAGLAGAGDAGSLAVAEAMRAAELTRTS